MKLKFGLNISLHFEIIDNEVGYTQDLYLDVNKITVAEYLNEKVLGNDVTIFADCEGERVYFSNFKELITTDRRKLLALRNIKLILS